MKIISLSSCGLRHISKDYLKSNFRFIVGDRKYLCNSLLADFISPKIAKIHASDPLFDEFTITVDDPNDCFQYFMNIIKGEKVVIPFKRRKVVIEIAKQLENNEIITKCIGSPNNQSFESLNTMLEEKLLHGVDVSKEIDLIASKFYASEVELIKLLPVDIILRIINSDKLVVESENRFLEFIFDVTRSLDEEDAKLFFNSVNIKNLSPECIKMFVYRVGITNLSQFTWDSLKFKILNKPISEMASKRYLNKSIDIPYSDLNTESEFFGIFRYLYAVTGQNPVDSGLVTITVKDPECKEDPKELFESESSKYPRWCLQEKENNYIMFDFGNAKVSLTAYTWRSGSDSSYWEYPVSFVWEGCDIDEPNKQWVEIDTKIENTELGKNDASYTWTINTDKKDASFNKIRFKLRNVSRNGGLYCTRVEIYGVYTPDPDKKDDYDFFKFDYDVVKKRIHELKT